MDKFPYRGSPEYALEVAQRTFDIDPQPSLFDQEDQDKLIDLAAQMTDGDRVACRELAAWMVKP